MHKAAHNGCCRRAAQTRALCSVLRKLLVSEKLNDLVETVEGPLVYSLPLPNKIITECLIVNTTDTFVWIGECSC